MKKKTRPAGIHLIIEFWGGKVIESVSEIKRILLAAAKKSNNTPVGIKIHKFNPRGLTGFILLAESHISIHTWPEMDYAAIDIFSCGRKSRPYKGLDYLKERFQPEEIRVRELKRGVNEKYPEMNLPGDWHFDRNFNSVDYLRERGVKLGLEVKKRIFKTESPFQTMEVIETKPYGRALILDGILQTTEKDEFLYHEMFIHPATMQKPDFKKALIIGGGDGGALREILKYPSLEKAFLVEIDESVVNLCKEHLPSLNDGAFDDERAEIIFGDGFGFIKNRVNFFDVIAVDSSDPIGPAQSLFTENFYKNIHSALKKDGICVIQAGVSSVLFENKVPRSVAGILGKIFRTVETRFVFIPSYNGLETFILASKSDLKNVGPELIERRFKKLNLDLRYYNPEIHFASKKFFAMGN